MEQILTLVLSLHTHTYIQRPYDYIPLMILCNSSELSIENCTQVRQIKMRLSYVNFNILHFFNLSPLISPLQNWWLIISLTNGLFGWREKGGGVEGSRIEQSWLKIVNFVLNLLYSTPPPSPSIQTDHKSLQMNSNNAPLI